MAHVGGGVDGVGGDVVFGIGAVVVGVAVLGLHEADVVLVRTGGAGESEMGAAESVGHAAGGDDEGFDDECAEDKGQDEGQNQRFDGFLEGFDSTFVGDGMRWFGHLFAVSGGKGRLICLSAGLSGRFSLY